MPAGAWEERILAARVAGYRPEWLDDLCHSGLVAWGRLAVRADGDDEAARRGSPPSRATPVGIVIRADLPWLLQAARGGAEPAVPVDGAVAEVVDALGRRGAQFHAEVVASTGRLASEVTDALWDAVARGLVTADGFRAIRSLLSARQRWDRRQQGPRRSLRRGAAGRVGGDGRWSLLPGASAVDDPDALAEAVAEQLLARWGVVFRDLLGRETLALPWREVQWALRRLEARGTIRGGRFVTGFTGEQYALPAAVDGLRAVRRSDHDGEVVRLSGADPLNLVGVITVGARVPAVRTNTVEYVDGVPVAPPVAAGS